MLSMTRLLNMVLLAIAISGFVFADSAALIAQDGEDWRLYKPKKDSSSAQLTERSDLKPQKPGKINIIQPADIEKLDSLKKMYPTKPSGYRVQIFFGKRDEAREKKVEFLQKYPDVGAYISYLAPNFRLRVGDFRTKIACEEFKREISEDFPASYIVKDKIEFFEFEKEED
jgi:hypothetical protein